MRLPAKDMAQSIGFNGCNDSMQDNRKGNVNSPLASTNRSLGRVVGFVGVVMVIVYHIMARNEPPMLTAAAAAAAASRSNGAGRATSMIRHGVKGQVRRMKEVEMYSLVMEE